MSILVNFVNFLIDTLVGAVNLLLAVFPTSPFRSAIEEVESSIGSDLLGYINYFIPFSEMLTILTVWVISIFLYYSVSIVMRWVKAIS